MIFQEAIPGGCDIRVTVVGDQLFPAQIVVPDGGYEYDFRLHTASVGDHPVDLAGHGDPACWR